MMRLLLWTFLVIGFAWAWGPSSTQVREFQIDRAIIREADQVPESVIEWADLHDVFEMKVEYGLEITGRGVSHLMFDGEGHVMVDYREKRK